jgi:hypothetical protein
LYFSLTFISFLFQVRFEPIFVMVSLNLLQRDDVSVNGLDFLGRWE